MTIRRILPMRGFLSAPAALALGAIAAATGLLAYEWRAAHAVRSHSIWTRHPQHHAGKSSRHGNAAPAGASSASPGFAPER